LIGICDIRAGPRAGPEVQRPFDSGVAGVADDDLSTLFLIRPHDHDRIVRGNANSQLARASTVAILGCDSDPSTDQQAQTGHDESAMVQHFVNPYLRAAEADVV
jgi:hypothetical protein